METLNHLLQIKKFGCLKKLGDKYAKVDNSMGYEAS